VRVPDERHQLSFTVPYTFGGEAGAPSGVGDVLLNYRYQLLSETDNRPAVAPRLSLVLPTGSYRDGLGDGSAGAQANLTASKHLTDHFTAHANLGGTLVPHARAPEDPPRTDSLAALSGGGSVIWEPYDAVNFLCELLASRDEEIGRRGTDERVRFTVSPGVRVGWNGPGGIQWVGGVSVPIGLTHDTDHFGVLLHVSIEHGITAAAHASRWP
jgi:Putative MetA-pathway of phenol degradation